MILYRIAQSAFLVTTTIVLAGCDSSSGTSDLAAYVKRIQSKPAVHVEPLPKPKPYLPFSYTATFMRSPFQNQDLILRNSRTAEGNKVPPPDMKRPKQPLESFDMSSFTMVGTLESNKEYYALLQAPTGVVRVKVGDYIGLHYGKIVSIDELGMKVIETISDGNEGWIQRPYTLELKNN